VESPWSIPTPEESSLNIEGDFAEWMQNEDEVRACLKSKHNLSAPGIDVVSVHPS
jgi:hypothetical protein